MERFSIPSGDPLNSDYVDTFGQPAYRIDTTSRSGGATNISRFVRTQNGVVQPFPIAQIEWHRLSADVFHIGNRIMDDETYMPTEGFGLGAKRKYAKQVVDENGMLIRALTRNRAFVSANGVHYHWKIDRSVCQLTTGQGALVASFTSSARSRLFGGGDSHLDVSRDAFNDLDEIVISAAFIAKCLARRRAAAAAAGAGA